jgi:hypothetical protein
MNANLINDGVKRYRQLNQNHLEQLDQGADGALSWVLPGQGNQL